MKKNSIYLPILGFVASFLSCESMVAEPDFTFLNNSDDVTMVVQCCSDENINNQKYNEYQPCYNSAAVYQGVNAQYYLTIGGKNQLSTMVSSMANKSCPSTGGKCSVNLWVGSGTTADPLYTANIATLTYYSESYVKDKTCYFTYTSTPSLEMAAKYQNKQVNKLGDKYFYICDKDNKIVAKPCDSPSCITNCS